MTVLDAVISGVIQGLTEFLPVSSSGHLVLLHNILGLKEPQLTFDIFLHLGTMISILIFFVKDIADIVLRNRRMLTLFILACIPTFIIGFAFKDAVEELFASPAIVGCMMVVNGVWLLAVHSIATKKQKYHAVSRFDSVIIGIAQGVAVIPGISRSGTTMGTGLMLGLEGSDAVRFSFLLSVPAILGASAVKFAQIWDGRIAVDTVPFIAGGLVALFTGLLAIFLLLKAVKASKLWAFGAYCILVGGITVFLLW